MRWPCRVVLSSFSHLLFLLFSYFYFFSSPSPLRLLSTFSPLLLLSISSFSPPPRRRTRTHRFPLLLILHRCNSTKPKLMRTITIPFLPSFTSRCPCQCRFTSLHSLARSPRYRPHRHLEPGLGHQVGISGGVSASETNVGKLLKLLQRQRLVKR